MRTGLGGPTGLDGDIAVALPEPGRALQQIFGIALRLLLGRWRPVQEAGDADEGVAEMTRRSVQPLRGDSMPRSDRPVRLLLAFLLLTLAGVGCASGRFDHPALTSERGEGAAQLVIIRTKELAMGAFALTVRVNGDKLVALRTGRYATLWLKPGTYNLTLDKPNDFMGTVIARLDGLELAPASRTYIQLGAQAISWSGSVGASSTGAVSSGVGAMPEMGFHRIGESTARRLMSEYEAVGAE